MSTLSAEVVALLRYLLPGFLAAWVFYGFTSHPKPSQFERIIQALIFTLVVQVAVYCLQSVLFLLGRVCALGEWTTNAELVCSVLCAAALGFVCAYFANTDKFHKQVRQLGITSETSYPSEWFGVLSANKAYIVLHLVDERRIYGWPIEWPSEPRKGHFCLVQASWLADGTPGKSEIPIAGSILVRAEDVKMVEFVPQSKENSNEQKDA